MKYACHSITIVADGSITGKKNADLTNGSFPANLAINKAIMMESSIVSGTAQSVNSPVFFIAKRKNSFCSRFLKLSNQTNLRMKALSVNAYVNEYKNGRIKKTRNPCRLIYIFLLS